jgi:hypothetical protein
MISPLAIIAGALSSVGFQDINIFAFVFESAALAAKKVSFSAELPGSCKLRRRVADFAPKIRFLPRLPC